MGTARIRTRIKTKTSSYGASKKSSAGRSNPPDLFKLIKVWVGFA
jgi:hypothetical protein